jgi:hypothetical protein
MLRRGLRRARLAMSDIAVHIRRWWSVMTVRLFGVCVVLALAAFMAVGTAPVAEAERGLPPCPPRERGAPKPEGCYDPCPKGMVGEAPNCSCPPGTVLAGRPRTPTERCVAVNYQDSITLEKVKKFPCPKGQIGTGPFNCHCPPGLKGPDCNQPMVKP